MSAPAPAVFFDRDDTLMPNVPYLGDPAQVRADPEAPATLARLRAAGFRLVLLSNQSGVGRGYVTREQVAAVNAELFRQLGLDFDGVYLCYEDPNNPATLPANGVSERKPSPVLAERAAAELGLALAASAVVGDRLADVRCARNAGMAAVLLTTNPGDRDFETARSEADFVTNGLPAAADWILARRKAK
ncbi:MAG: HAD-IIIA family hydrolase [Verrucomicrobiota bacterium]